MPEPAPGVAVVLAAAGRGERLGGSVPKALIPLGGRPLVTLSLATAGSCDAVTLVVVAAPPSHVGQISEAVDAAAVETPTVVVPGGASRQESIRMALEAVPRDVAVVVCHDAARPFASRGLFERVIRAVQAASGADGAVPIIRPTDTVKQLEGDAVTRTIPRESLGLAQTPQAFLAERLREAHASAVRRGLEGTDDAMLLELAGMPVVAVPGELANVKITTPEDLDRAERMIEVVR